ncbi:Carboxypeptidase regulatory-like domain-containing protein, partial [Candidatus Methanophagaceae archaeon]
SATAITVLPGESIQEAINNLPAEGGIVELAPGIHEVNDTLYPPGSWELWGGGSDSYSILVNTCNVTIQGTHNSIVRHHNKSISCFYVPDLELVEGADVFIENVTFDGFNTSSTYTQTDNALNSIISATHVKNFTVKNMYDGSWARRLVAVGCSGTHPRYSYNVYYTNNVMAHSGPVIGFVHNVSIVNNSILGNSATFSLYVDRNSYYVKIIGNKITSTGTAAMVLDGPQGPWEVRDNIVHGSRQGIRFEQAPSDMICENNTITGTGQHGGITIYGRSFADNVTIRNNRIYDCCYGIYATEYVNPSGTYTVNVTNNVIYNCDADGIYMSPDKDSINLTVTNNIITNNGGYGINHMGGNISHSHNNIWGNALGRYDGTTADESEIEVDPKFADPIDGDFHLKSAAGRKNTKNGEWVIDTPEDNSPCIDAGDPVSDYFNEPDYPLGLINMGAYGNTEEASLTSMNSSAGDTSSPYTSDHNPTKNATGIPRDTNIVVHIRDDGDGVDNTSIVMIVEGTQVTPTITGTTNDYTVTYTPPTPFDYEQVVDITIDARDLASSPNVMPQDIYSFTVEAGTEPSSFFSDLTVTAIRNTAVVIRWNTDTAATGQIEYGLDTNYGSLTGEEGISYWHPIEVTGLNEGTTYHYRIREKDYKGTETISDDYTFTTRTTEELENVIRAARSGGDLPKIYYVKPNGNNSDNGLFLETAWETPYYAAQQAEAGDMIYVVNGTYTYFKGVSFTNNGIPEAPVTMKAYNGTPITEYGVVIEANYITLDGFAVRGGGHGIDVRYSTGIKILNCEVCNSGTDGIYFRDVTYSIIENTTVHDSGWNGFGLKPNTHWPASGHHIMLRKCTAYDNMNHNQFDIQSDYLTVEDCVANHSSLSPMQLWGDYVVVNNFTGQNGNNGIKIYEIHNSIIMNCTLPDMGITNPEYVENVTIYNNYINYSYCGMYLNSNTGNTIEGNEIHTQELYGYTYEFMGTGDFTVRDDETSPYKVRSTNGAKITVEYTDGRTFSVDGSGEYTTYTFSSGTHKIEVVGWASVGNIYGTVTDVATGSVIEGATVAVEGTEKSSTTCADGIYTIAHVPMGTYTVIALADGYENSSKDADLWANQTEVNIQLTPDTAMESTIHGTVTTNTTQSETGIPDTNVTLATYEGAVINTTQTDSTGHYVFTNVAPGFYDLTATKRSYWPDSDPVTVNASEQKTEYIVLCRKGDFNTNSEPADAGDLAMMVDATVNATLQDWTYDLDGDGNPANEADLTLLREVSVGVAVLE